MAAVLILADAARVRVRMLVGAYVAGRRRRPGDVFYALRDEAQLLLHDQRAELLDYHARIAPPARARIDDRQPAA